MKTLSETGETEIVARFCKMLPTAGNVIVGPGDDCAVVRPYAGSSHDWVLTSDPVIEGVHFKADAAASAIGHKAVARALSDLAAMGAEPCWALVNITAPGSMAVSRLRALQRGIASAADRYGLLIVGGDSAEARQFAVHVFAVGSLPKGTALKRTGARAGDNIYATGKLGGSSLGRHLRFEPRLAAGGWLRTFGLATAAMDISDGLDTDLRHLCRASRKGAVIRVDRLPVSAAARRMPGRLSPIEHALVDGEDYELLFTVPRSKQKRFIAEWQRRFSLRVTEIGRVTAKPNAVEYVDADGKTIASPGGGYEHFAGSR